MKNPSSLSNRRPHAGHALLTSNHAPRRNRVDPPQLGQRLSMPRPTIWSRVTFTGAALAGRSVSELEADEPAHLHVLSRLGYRLGEEVLDGLLGHLDVGLVEK